MAEIPIIHVMKRSLLPFKAALFALLLCLTIVTARGQVVVPETGDILSNAQELSASDEERQAALQKLRSYPRANVVEALRSGMRSSEVQLPAIVRAAIALELRELLPDLRARLATKDPSWVIVAGVTALAKDEKDPKERAALAKIYKDRLEEAGTPSAAKLALLDGLSELREPISSDAYLDFLADKSNSIVESAVHHFVITRSMMPKDEQIKRFKLAFRVRPTLARLEAFEAFGAMKPEDKKLLRPAFTNDTCEIQKDRTAKEFCERVARGLGIQTGGSAK
jgi:hypothetical protein